MGGNVSTLRSKDGIMPGAFPQSIESLPLNDTTRPRIAITTLHKSSLELTLPGYELTHFPIIKLPRELRDRFYALWLEVQDTPVDLHSGGYLQQGDQKLRLDDREWIHGPFSSTFYNPTLKVHRNAPLQARTHGINVPQYIPKLWHLNRQIRAESQQVHLHTRMQIDSRSTDAAEAAHNFLNTIVSAKDARAMHKLFVQVCCLTGVHPSFLATLNGPDGKGRGEDHLQAFFDGKDPLFKIDLSGDKKTMSVFSYAKLVDEQEHMMQEIMQVWAMTRSKGYVFGGQDLVEVAHLLRKIAVILRGRSQMDVYYKRIPKREPQRRRFWEVEASELNTETYEGAPDEERVIMGMRLEHKMGQSCDPTLHYRFKGSGHQNLIVKVSGSSDEITSGGLVLQNFSALESALESVLREPWRAS